MINQSIFKAYDIRGIYPEDLNSQTITPIIKAIYTFFTTRLEKKPLSVVIGHDMRLSSPELFQVAQDTLVEMGADVIDIGLVSTPTFYFSVFNYGFDCGIQITASHNPKEYNGMKFVLNSPQGLIKIGKSTGMDEIIKLANEDKFTNSQTPGTLTKKQNVLTDEVQNALKLFGNPPLKKFKIVADPANAMGAQYIEALFQKVPSELIKMNFELDGSFPSHQPDPLDFDNLKDLQKKVIEEKADFGLAPDGDGDRLFFTDEQGKVVPATIITALVASELLKENPGSTVLFDVRYILTPTKIIEELGGESGVTKVGHAYITESMGQQNAIFAGESSAHYYYKATGNAESQLATIIAVLKVLTEQNKTLSEVVKKFQRSFESGEINFKVSNANKIIEQLKSRYKDGELNDLDGIAISYPNWRFSIRTSNTEPLLRLNLEALDQPTMEEKKKELVSYIETVAKKE